MALLGGPCLQSPALFLPKPQPILKSPCPLLRGMPLCFQAFPRGLRRHCCHCFSLSPALLLAGRGAPARVLTEQDSLPPFPASLAYVFLSLWPVCAYWSTFVSTVFYSIFWKSFSPAVLVVSTRGVCRSLCLTSGSRSMDLHPKHDHPLWPHTLCRCRYHSWLSWALGGYSGTLSCQSQVPGAHSQHVLAASLKLMAGGGHRPLAHGS